MTKKQRGRPEKTDKDEMLNVIRQIINDKIKEKEKQDEEKPETILITTNRLKSHYQIKQDIDISRPTLRSHGFCKDGYFCIKWPSVFQYNSQGNRSYRGMLIHVENFENEIGLKTQ